MQYAVVTGNPSYSIPPYSCVAVWVGGHVGTVGDHIVDRRYGGTQ